MATKFKIISCRATGVPGTGEGNYVQKIENALNDMSRKGLTFVSVLNDDMWVFKKTVKRKRKK